MHKNKLVKNNENIQVEQIKLTNNIDNHII